MLNDNRNEGNTTEELEKWAMNMKSRLTFDTNQRRVFHRGEKPPAVKTKINKCRGKTEETFRREIEAIKHIRWPE